MNLKSTKVIRIVLLVIACIACATGIIITNNVAKEEATDISKIKVTVTSQKSYTTNQVEYIIEHTFLINNGTNVDWNYLEIMTYVYDKNGKQIGSFSSTIGSEFGLRLKVGESLSRDCILSSKYPSGFFQKMYESNFSDLKYISKVTYGTYYGD